MNLWRKVCNSKLLAEIDNDEKIERAKLGGYKLIYIQDAIHLIGEENRRTVVFKIPIPIDVKDVWSMIYEAQASDDESHAAELAHHLGYKMMNFKGRICIVNPTGFVDTTLTAREVGEVE